MTHALITRRDAAQATLDAFVDQPFTWGKFDCAKMLAFHLRQLGHEVKLAPAGTYTTALGAQRALRRLGFASLTAWLDARYPQIAPAAAIVGDVIALPGDSPLGAIGIVVGNGRAISYHESVPGAVVVQPLQMDGAWRVDP